VAVSGATKSMSCEAVSAKRKTLKPRSMSLLSYIAQRLAMAANRVKRKPARP